MLNKMTRCIFSALAFAVIVASPLSGRCEEQVLPDQFIVSGIQTPHIGAALDLLERSNKEEATVLDAAQFSLLVELGDEDNTEPATIEEEGTFVEYDRSSDACLKLDSLRRRISKAVLTALRNNQNVKYADLLAARLRITCDATGVVKRTATPNDQYFPQQWEFQSGPNGISAPEAWNYAQGSSDIVVPVIDTGVDYNHPDLAGNMWKNTAEVAGNGVDDDANGYVDDIYGYDMVNNDSDPMDDQGHGTHCAGTIGARSNNFIGVSGVNWNVRIMALKFLAANGYGSYFAAEKALDYATEMKKRGHRIVVTNNSWGSYYAATNVLNAIRRATAQGILTVAAAGNDTKNTDTSPHYPSSWSDPGIISVAATNSSGNLASFSHYGLSSVHIAAPGESIASTVRNGGYSYMSGTSMAAPHVTGAVALLASYAQGLSADQLKGVILNSAVNMGSPAGKVPGNRYLNLFTMLQGASNPPPAAPTPTPTLPPTPAPTPTPTPTPAPGNWDIKVFVHSSSIPIEGATVTLKTDKNITSTATTGPSGTVLFPAILGPVQYTLTISKPGAYVDQKVNSYLSQNVMHPVELSGVSYAIKVKAVNSFNLPLNGVLINGGALGNLTTSNNGEVTFSAQYGKEYNFSAALGGYFFRNMPQGVVYGNATRVILGKKLP